MLFSCQTHAHHVIRRLRLDPNICALLSPDALQPNGESWNRLWWNSLSTIGLSTRHVSAHRQLVDFSHFLSAVSIDRRQWGSILVPMASVRRTILENSSSCVLSCLLYSTHHSYTRRRTSKWPRKTLRQASSMSSLHANPTQSLDVQYAISSRVAY